MTNTSPAYPCLRRLERTRLPMRVGFVDAPTIPIDDGAKSRSNFPHLVTVICLTTGSLASQRTEQRLVEQEPDTVIRRVIVPRKLIDVTVPSELARSLEASEAPTEVPRGAFGSVGCLAVSAALTSRSNSSNSSAKASSSGSSSAVTCPAR